VADALDANGQTDITPVGCRLASAGLADWLRATSVGNVLLLAVAPSGGAGLALTAWKGWSKLRLHVPKELLELLAARVVGPSDTGEIVSQLRPYEDL
jgi:hypothetical protein